MIIVRAGAAELIHSVATDAWRKFTAYEGVIGFVVGRGGEHLKLAEVQPVFGCFRQNLAVERGNALLPCGAKSFPTAIAHHNRYAKLPQVIRQRQAPMSAPNDQYALPTGACDTEPTRETGRPHAYTPVTKATTDSRHL